MCDRWVEREFVGLFLSLFHSVSHFGGVWALKSFLSCSLMDAKVSLNCSCRGDRDTKLHSRPLCVDHTHPHMPFSTSIPSRLSLWGPSGSRTGGFWLLDVRWILTFLTKMGNVSFIIVWKFLEKTFCMSPIIFYSSHFFLNFQNVSVPNRCSRAHLRKPRLSPFKPVFHPVNTHFKCLRCKVWVECDFWRGRTLSRELEISRDHSGTPTRSSGFIMRLLAGRSHGQTYLCS